MSGLLSAGEIASMRETAHGVMPDTCAILRMTSTSDGGGNRTATWSTVTAGMPCAIAPVGGGETGRSAGEQLADETTHIVTLPANTTIDETRRIVIDDQTYDVTLVRKRGSWELVRRVEVKEAP